MDNSEIYAAVELYGIKAQPEGVVCGNSLIDKSIYGVTTTYHVEADEEMGVEEHDEVQEPCIIDYLRSAAGNQLLALNARFEDGLVAGIAALVEGDELIRNYAEGAWYDSDCWSV